jgi:hypothetical protein
MRRRWGLLGAGIATLLLLLAMAPADGRMKDTGGPGIVPFELTGGQDRADEIMAEWGEDGQDAARESLWIDFGGDEPGRYAGVVEPPAPSKSLPAWMRSAMSADSSR